jgi:hypothetical protein
VNAWALTFAAVYFGPSPVPDPALYPALLCCAGCRYVSQVATVNALEPAMCSLTDSQLAEQTLRFRDILARNTHRFVGIRVQGLLFSKPLAAAANEGLCRVPYVGTGRGLVCVQRRMCI